MSRKRKHNNRLSSSAIDVVVTCGGRFDMLEKCLDALYREAQYVPLGIFIMDNASDQGERIQNEHLFKYVPEKDPAAGVREFRTNRTHQQLGFPESNNIMAKMGRAPLILFLNDDVELHEGSLSKIVDTFDEPSYGIVGIKLIFPPTVTGPGRPAGKVQHVGWEMNVQGNPIHPLIGWSPDHPKTCVSRECFAVTGAALTIRRSLFNKIGGFPMIYGKGTWEDIDICIQTRLAGFKVYVNTDATGYHYVGATQEKLRSGYPLFNNRTIFQARWEQTGLLSWGEWMYW